MNFTGFSAWIIFVLNRSTVQKTKSSSFILLYTRLDSSRWKNGYMQRCIGTFYKYNIWIRNSYLHFDVMPPRDAWKCIWVPETRHPFVGIATIMVSLFLLAAFRHSSNHLSHTKMNLSLQSSAHAVTFLAINQSDWTKMYAHRIAFVHHSKSKWAHKLNEIKSREKKK